MTTSIPPKASLPISSTIGKGDRIPKYSAHADLWDRISQQILRLGADDVDIAWVKGHTTHEDVASGKTSAINKWGNGGSDGLATRARDRNAILGIIRDGANSRAALAMLVQKLMINILIRRQEIRRRLGCEEAAPKEENHQAEEPSDDPPPPVTSNCAASSWPA